MITHGPYVFTDGDGDGQGTDTARRNLMSSSHSTSVEVHGEGVKARVGMWLFLLSEILLFGGLFLLYAVYRSKHPVDFHAASLELSRFDGTLNTAVLLTSSLTAVLAIYSLQIKRNTRRAAFFLAATIALGLTFLVVKAFEWAAKFEHGLYPGGGAPGESAPRGDPLSSACTSP